MINKLRKIADKEFIKAPTPQALARYHLFEAVKHLNGLYKGNISHTDLDRLKETINMVVKQNNLNDHDHLEAKMFHDGEILKKYKPVIEIRVKKEIKKVVEEVKHDLGITDEYIFIVSEVKGNASVKIHSVLHNDHIRDYHEILKKKIVDKLDGKTT